MKKFITYGVAAALTMSSFALPARVPVYADGGAAVSALTCAGADVADATSTVRVGLEDASCELSFSFTNELKPNVMNGSWVNNVFTGVDLGSLNPFTRENDNYKMTYDQYKVTVTIKQAGLDLIRAGQGDVSLRLAYATSEGEGDEVMSVKLTASVPVEKITAEADKTTVEAGGSIVITPTINEGNGTTDAYTVVYEVVEDGADYVDGEITVDNDGKATVKFKNEPYAENKTVKISAKAMVGGEAKATTEKTVDVTVLKNVEEIGAELSEGSISGTTDTENKKDSSTANGKVTKGGYTGDGIKYTVDSENKGSVVAIDENGVISVVDTYVASSNKEVKITVSATVDGKEFKSNEVTLNVLPNFTEVKTDALETTDVTMDAPVAVKASTNYPGSLVPVYKFEATENADAVEIETVNNTATVKVNGKHVSKEDTKVLVKVSAKIGDVTVEKADEIELTVKPNFTKVELNADKTEVNAGDTATVTATTDYEGTQEAKYDFQMIGGVEGITFTTDGNKAAVKVAESYVADSDVAVEVKAKVTIGDVEIDETESVTIKANKNFTKVETEASAETIANGDTVTITPSSDYTGAIEYDYAAKNAEGLEITKNEKGEFEVKISDSYIATEDKDAEITIKGTAGGLTKWAETIKLTVSANFKGIKAELSEDEIKPSETATIIVTPEGGYTGDGIKYTYTVAEDYVDLVTVEEVETTDEETGETKTETVVKVSDKYVSSTGEDVDITVSADGYDGMEETLTLAIAKNYTFVYNDYEVIEGDEQTYAMGSGDELVVKIDGPDDKVTGVAVYNETLWERFWNDEELTDDEKKAMSFENMVEGEDYIIEHGSTVVTLTDSFMAKLMAGEHTLYVGYYDDTDIDDILEGYALSTFTVAEATAPDTGANTKVASGATASVMGASVIAMLGVAAAFIRKRFAANRK